MDEQTVKYTVNPGRLTLPFSNCPLFFLSGFAVTHLNSSTFGLVAGSLTASQLLSRHSPQRRAILPLWLKVRIIRKPIRCYCAVMASRCKCKWRIAMATIGIATVGAKVTVTPARRVLDHWSARLGAHLDTCRHAQAALFSVWATLQTTFVDLVK